MTDNEKLIDDALTAFADREITAPGRDDLRIALEAFEASLTRCGCAACTTARRERIALTDHDRTALARVLHEIVYSPGANFDRAVPGIQEHMLACAEKVAAALPWVVPTAEVTLEVGEAHTPTDMSDPDWYDTHCPTCDAAVPAHTAECAVPFPRSPTDNERDALQRAIEEAPAFQEYAAGRLADAILAAGFRRTEVPEPSAYGAGDWDNRDDEVEGETRGFLSCGSCDWSMARGLFADLHEHERIHQSEPQGEPSDAQKAGIAADALEQEVTDFEHDMGIREFDEATSTDGRHWAAIDEAWNHQGPFMDWLRVRAAALRAAGGVR